MANPMGNLNAYEIVLGAIGKNSDAVSAVRNTVDAAKNRMR